jgi:predicted ATP-grasp superfamily ATP-dependent carboligase
LKFREFLEENFNIQLPSDDTVRLLLDKNRFSEYAEDNSILIPRCNLLLKDADLDCIAGTMNFPIILKPSIRTSRWLEARLPKAYHLCEMDDLRKVYREIKPVESRLLVQEFIPGNDSNIQYCLTYFTDKCECLSGFTGVKIRQWPVGLGSTATTAPVENPGLLETTSEIFRKLNFKGFGSIEYKRHEENGKYYLIEPTVGRMNQQEYVATLNGVNLPLRCYNYLTGSGFEEKLPPRRQIIYIDELVEPLSAYVHIRKKIISLKEYLRSMKGPRRYRYTTSRDPGVFLGFFAKVARIILRKLLEWLRFERSNSLSPPS